MSIYCNHLDISFNPLKDMSYIKRWPTDVYGMYSIDRSEASDEMVELLKKNKVVRFSIEAFCCPANYKLAVHCDDDYFGKYSKVNFVYSEDPNHTMDWYEPNEKWVEEERKQYTLYENKDDPNDQDLESSPHYWFNDDELTLVHQETIRVAQINAGLPHGVTTGTTNRICISFILEMADGNMMDIDNVFQTS